ncbi:MAG: RDD family protein [Telluria sp.]
MQATKPVQVATPTVRRRLMAMLYEVFLLFAVEMLAIALYMLVTLNSQHPVAKMGMNLWLVLTAAAYFMFCWIDSGHTLAMKTWRIKVVKLGCQQVPFRAAALRFLAAWGWILPALLLRELLGLHGKGETAALLAAGFVAWTLTAFLDKDRQFLHDRLAGTRLIELPKRVKR